MSNEESQNHSNISPKLILPPHLNKNERMYFKKLYQNLPQMNENELNIIGIELEIKNLQIIKTIAFIRSTVKKAIQLESTPLILLDKNLESFAEKEETFTDLGTLSPNTSKLVKIEFSKKNFIQDEPNFNLLENWSIAFKENTKHQVDFSDMDQDEISDSTKEWLNELDKKEPLDKNELSFMGFSAKQDEASNLLVSLLIRNGTNRNLDIKQLPLKFYDATGKLAAKGTFKIDDLTVLANTSKPLTLIFPVSSITKENLDLSKWSLVHNE